MDEMDKYYQIFGLKPGASEKEIVEAYKVLVKVWNPDRFSDDPNIQKIATEKIKKIDEAFKQLLIRVASHHESGTPPTSQQEPLYEPSSKPLPRDDLKRSTEQVVVSPLGNEKDSSVEKPISTSALWKEISFNKLLLFIMLLPAAVILLDGFLGFTFYDLSRKLAGSEFGIIVYIFYFSLGIWIADYIYKLRELTLIIVLSFIVLFFYRFLIAISLYYEFIGQVMINTLKEGVIVYASLSLFSFLFRYFDPRFDYAEICNIIEFTDPITKKKYDRGTCTKCGSITIVAKERAISFLGKSTKYFCDNCNRFLRGNPLNNIFLGLTESASSLIFMLGIASYQQGKASSYSSIFLLLFFVGIYDGIKRLYFGISGVKRSSKKIPKVFPKQNELEKLAELKDKGIITEEEFKKKQKLDLEIESHHESEPPPKSEKEKTSTTGDEGHGGFQPPPEQSFSREFYLILGIILLGIIIMAVVLTNPSLLLKLDTDRTNPTVSSQNKGLTAMDWYNKGYSFQSSGNYKEAIDAYDRAIDLVQSSKFYAYRGSAYYKLGDFQQAIWDCSKAIQLNPEETMAYNYRGSVFYMKREYDNALEDFNKAIVLDSQNDLAYIMRGKINNVRSQYDKAIEDLSKAISINPKEDYAYVIRGMVYYKKGQHKRAIEDFSKAISMNPKKVSAYDNRGYVYLDLGKYQQAINDFQKTIQLDEKCFDAHIGLSIVFFRQKRIEQAKMCYQKAIDIEPLSKEGADALEREKGYFYTTSQKQTINKILKLF